MTQSRSYVSVFFVSSHNIRDKIAFCGQAGETPAKSRWLCCASHLLILRLSLDGHKRSSFFTVASTCMYVLVVHFLRLLWVQQRANPKHRPFRICLRWAVRVPFRSANNCLKVGTRWVIPPAPANSYPGEKRCDLGPAGGGRRVGPPSTQHQDPLLNSMI